MTPMPIQSVHDTPSAEFKLPADAVTMTSPDCAEGHSYKGYSLDVPPNTPLSGIKKPQSALADLMMMLPSSLTSTPKGACMSPFSMMAQADTPPSIDGMSPFSSVLSQGAPPPPPSSPAEGISERANSGSGALEMFTSAVNKLVGKRK